MQQFISLTWNIEGFSRSKYISKSLIDETNPDFIFLSEPQLYSCDLLHEMSLFKNSYSSCLNSIDLFDNDFPLTRRKTIGGTMVLWKHELDQFVTQLSCPSPSILPILFSPPLSKPSVHVTLYLPTAGRNEDFLMESANLIHYLDKLEADYPDALLFIHGDSNVNPNDCIRRAFFAKALQYWAPKSITYQSTNLSPLYW